MSRCAILTMSQAAGHKFLFNQRLDITWRQETDLPELQVYNHGMVARTINSDTGRADLTRLTFLSRDDTHLTINTILAVVKKLKT